MSQRRKVIEPAAQILLLALAAVFSLLVLLSWGLAAWWSTQPNVASIRKEVLFFDTGAFSVILVSLVAWAHVRQQGLRRTVLLALAAWALAWLCIALMVLSGGREFEITAIPENLSYEFLASHSPAQYRMLWSQAATSTAVERWQLTQYGFPETFLHSCKGLSITGQYVMLDHYRLAFDWLLAFAALVLVMMGTSSVRYAAAARRSALL